MENIEIPEREPIHKENIITLETKIPFKDIVYNIEKDYPICKTTSESSPSSKTDYVFYYLYILKEELL